MHRRSGSHLLLSAVSVLVGCVPASPRSMYVQNERLQVVLTEPTSAVAERVKLQDTQKEMAAAAIAAVVIPFVAEKAYDYAVKRAEKEREKYHHSTSSVVAGEGLLTFVAKPHGTVSPSSHDADLVVGHPERILIYRTASREVGEQPKPCMLMAAKLHVSQAGTALRLEPQYLVYDRAGAKIPQDGWLPWRWFDDLIDRRVDSSIKLRLEVVAADADGKVTQALIAEEAIPVSGIELDEGSHLALYLPKGGDVEMAREAIIADCALVAGGTACFDVAKREARGSSATDLLQLRGELPATSKWLTAPPMPVREVESAVPGVRAFELAPISRDESNPTRSSPHALTVTVEEANDLGDVLGRGIEFAKDHRDEVLEEIKNAVKAK